MKLEAGKCYRNRRGEKRRIVSDMGGKSAYPFVDEFGAAYRVTGASAYSHEYDLIAEWTDEPDLKAQSREAFAARQADPSVPVESQDDSGRWHLCDGDGSLYFNPARNYRIAKPETVKPEVRWEVSGGRNPQPQYFNDENDAGHYSGIVGGTIRKFVEAVE